jgi:starvation-inducible outer membrane lipoprotein
VSETPTSSHGTVISGGKFIKTVNGLNSGAFYFLKLPLGSGAKTRVRAIVYGRFIASRKGFLDPEADKRGQRVTVATAIAGLEGQPSCDHRSEVFRLAGNICAGIFVVWPR